LHAVAEILNSLLNLVFEARAEILAFPLCSGNAYGFGRDVSASAIHRQAREIAGTDGGVPASASAKSA
jgi:hypothetical protein